MNSRPFGRLDRQYFNVALLRERLDWSLKCLAVEFHPLQQDAVRQCLVARLPELLDQLQTLGVERILSHVTVCHEQHPLRLVH